MSDYEKKVLDVELKKFASRNFEKPSNCRNSEQIRYYVRELCLKIEEYEKRFKYVPTLAYVLLVKYNARQNTLICRDFTTSYS
jgi:hypothetical protein